MSEILTLIITSVSTIIASGALTFLAFYKIKKRIKTAEAKKEETTNDIMIATEWKEIAEKFREQVDHKDTKIENLFISINQWRDKHNELVSKNHALKLEQLSDKYRMCNRRMCTDREPQTGY